MMRITEQNDICHLSFWDIDSLCKAPKIYPATKYDTREVRAVFYQGLNWRGRQTRVFARYGFPDLAAEGKVPAVVLVHGKRGTAFAEWVRIWNQRGYAAIAMDWNNALPEGEYPNMPRHEYSGPPPFGFDQVDDHLEDQWAYHSVANIILAHSLLRSFNNKNNKVDHERIGLVGISWGAHLVCLAASVDHRCKFSALVYGCGFLDKDCQCLPDLASIGPDRAAKWFERWDPKHYLSNVELPMLWLTGTNDPYYPLDSFQNSYRLPRGDRTLVVKVEMEHGHEPGWSQEEMFAFADSVLTNGLPLAKITQQGCAGRKAWGMYSAPSRLVRAEFNYTTQLGKWPSRKWIVTEAQVDEDRSLVTAGVPENATAYYFNLIDERDLVVSTEHVAVP